MKGELLSHWQIQENLLQSYRELFLTSQSIIFSIAAIIATEHRTNKGAFIILLVLGLVLLYFWWNIGKARGLDVSYFQMLLIKSENNEQVTNILTNFKKWQGLEKEEKIKRLKEFNLAKSKTRTIMEVYVPFLFLILWIGLSLTSFYLN